MDDPRIDELAHKFYHVFLDHPNEEHTINSLRPMVHGFATESELRFKLPVNEKQVADTVLTLSRNDTTFGNNNSEGWLIKAYCSPTL